MIDETDFAYIQGIRQFNTGEWNVIRRYGWMPQTAHIDTLFVQPKLEITICWQRPEYISLRPSLCYYVIRVHRQGKRVDMMIEVDDVMRLIEMVFKILCRGICAVDTEARRVDRARYLGRDQMRRLVSALRSGKSALEEWCEENEKLQSEVRRFERVCMDTYTNQRRPVKLFSASAKRCEKHGCKYVLDIIHTPIHRNGKAKAQPVRLRVTRQCADCDEKEEAYVDITVESLLAVAEAMWEGYLKWFHAPRESESYST